MDKGFLIIKTEINISVNGQMIKKMEMVNFNFLMEMLMKENTRMINLMAREFIPTRMEINM